MESHGVVELGHEVADADLSSPHQRNASRYDLDWYVVRDVYGLSSVQL